QNTDGRVAQPSLWRKPKEQTSAPTTTGDKSKPTDAAPAPAPDGPVRFDGKGGKAIIKEKVPNKSGGTIELPALKVPTVEGGVKGASNHSVAAIKGVPAKDKNPMVAGQAFEFLGGTPRGSITARRNWIAAAIANANLQKALKTQIET